MLITPRVISCLSIVVESLYSTDGKGTTVNIII
ncbi:hypothetical protein [Brochothrix phage ADU4]|nr:hypothetical protein [Brochothrix phage ADU4]